MSALHLAWHRSWRTLAWYGVFTAWGIGCLLVSVVGSVGLRGVFGTEAKNEAMLLAGVCVAATLGHIAGNVLALVRLRLWVVAVIGSALALTLATCMTALGDGGSFFVVFAIAVLGGWLGVASRMEVLGAWLPLTYAVGASVMWMNTHERVSVWLTGSKFAVWDPVTFAFLAGGVLLFVVFLSARHALALTLWRDAARPGFVSVDDDIARAGKGSGGVVLCVATLLVMATAVLSPFLFRTEADPEEQVAAASIATTAPSYATHFSAGAPAAIHVGGGTVYVDDNPLVFPNVVADAYNTAHAIPVDDLAMHTVPSTALSNAHPSTTPPMTTPPLRRIDDDMPAPTHKPEAAGCEHLSGAALFSCMTQLKTKHPPKPMPAPLAPSTAAPNNPIPQPLYTEPAPVIYEPTKVVHTHTKHAPVGTVHVGHGVGVGHGVAVGHGAHGSAHVHGPAIAHAAPVVAHDDVVAPVAPVVPPAPVEWKDGVTASVAAPANPGTPIPDAGDTAALAAASTSPNAQPDVDRTLDEGQRAARHGLILVALSIALLVALAAAALSFRPVRRAFLLRHLERPLWATTPTRRVENLWLRALIALDDFGIRERAGDTPEKLAFRANGVLTQELGEVPRGIDAAARIMERIEYAGRGLSPDEETKMRKAVFEFLAYVSRHVGVGRKISLAWSPVRDLR